jgi:hypothetical protein
LSMPPVVINLDLDRGKVRIERIDS